MNCYNFTHINHNNQDKNRFIHNDEENTEKEDNTICIYWHPTSSEIGLLRETWSDDIDFLYNIGSQIYIYIFEHNPDTIELFPKIHKHGERWKDSPEFRAQSLKFVQTLTMCIELLDKMDRMAENLRTIGEHHVQYAKRGFKPIYWNIFYDALKFSLFDHLNSFIESSDQKYHDIINAWNKLAHYIITQMKRGYVHKLVKEFQEQDDTFSIWAGRHPSFSSATHSKEKKQEK
uniref:Globin family profile domain-containing protein n=1 Tax=Acrobeloides nanus TaxID=290746 RepID=A0A914C2A2_9BILA